MAETGFDRSDHKSHIRRYFELAQEAGRRGDGPSGSVLVLGDSNRVGSENYIRRLPELHLAYLATHNKTNKTDRGIGGRLYLCRLSALLPRAPGPTGADNGHILWGDQGLFGLVCSRAIETENVDGY